MLNIRIASLSEVGDIQNLNNEVFIDNAKYDSDLDLSWAKGKKGESYFSDLLKDNNSVCLIAEENGQKIGYLVGAPKEIDFRNSNYFEIQNMGVNPEHRSRGVGKQLIQRCAELAKLKGYSKLILSVYFKNHKAIDFYKDNGFTEIDISLEKIL